MKRARTCKRYAHKSSRHRSDALERRAPASGAWTDHERTVLERYGTKVSTTELMGMLGGRHGFEAIRTEMKRIGCGGQNQTSGLRSRHLLSSRAFGAPGRTSG